MTEIFAFIEQWWVLGLFIWWLAAVAAEFPGILFWYAVIGIGIYGNL